MSSPATPHPGWIWLPIVAGLIGLCAWVALTRADPAADPAASAAPALPASIGVAPDEKEDVAEPTLPAPTAVAGFGGGGGSASQPTQESPPELDPGSAAEPSVPEPGETAAASTLAADAKRQLASRSFADARRSAEQCLKLEPNNVACARARVHSYTQQYPLSETSEIVRWCLSPFASDLNCLRQLRVFHQGRGERMQASGLSAEIRERYPDANLELPSTAEGEGQ